MNNIEQNPQIGNTVVEYSSGAVVNDNKAAADTTTVTTSCRLLGFQAQLLSGSVLRKNNAVPFDTVVNDADCYISYIPDSGEFALAQPGNYYVAWSVNVDQFQPGSINFGIALDGEIVSNVDAWVQKEQVGGQALVTVCGNLTVLELVNLSCATVYYDKATNVYANIVIIHVDD